MMPSWPQLLILIVVIVLLFGTKKLRSLGSDLGASIKGFKKAMNDDDKQGEKTNNDVKTENGKLNKIESHDTFEDNKKE